MNLPAIVLCVILYILECNGYKNLNIRKCCPEDQPLTPTYPFSCQETEDYEEVDVGGDSLWFPIEVALNATTLKPLTAADQKAVAEEILGITTRQHGFPNCLPLYEANFAFYINEYDDDFRVVFGDSERQSGIFLGNVSELPSMAQNTGDHWLLPFEDICLDSYAYEREQIFVVFYCPTINTPWIRKCCPVGFLYNTSSEECFPIQHHIPDWSPNSDPGQTRFYIRPDSRPNCTSDKDFALLRSEKQDRNCRGIASSSQTVTFLPTGAIQIKGATYEANEYCGESTWHHGNRILDQNFVVCGEKPVKSTKNILYGILFIVGGLCLLVTVFISLWLPELHRTLNNRLALTHNATLMVAYFAWGASQVAPALTIRQCTALSLTIQFTFLGSLLWLNAMCIDMSSSFRTYRLASRSTWKRYLIYSAYAWGLTSLISIFTACMEFVEELPYGLPRPGFACICDFARNTYSVFIYFYGPMAAILAFNFVLYISTVWKIVSVHRQTKILNEDNSKTAGGATQTDKQRLIVYTKLFVLMGLTWLTEILGWALNGDNGFWLILDIINLLRAIFIFAIFICKRPVLRSIQTRIKGFRDNKMNSSDGHSSVATVRRIANSFNPKSFQRSTAMELNKH